MVLTKPGRPSKILLLNHHLTFARSLPLEPGACGAGWNLSASLGSCSPLQESSDSLSESLVGGVRGPSPRSHAACLRFFMNILVCIFFSERRGWVRLVQRVGYSAGEGGTDWSLRGFGATRQGDRHAASPCTTLRISSAATRCECLLIGTGRLASKVPGAHWNNWEEEWTGFN